MDQRLEALFDIRVTQPLRLPERSQVKVREAGLRQARRHQFRHDLRPVAWQRCQAVEQNLVLDTRKPVPPQPHQDLARDFFAVPALAEDAQEASLYFRD